MRFRRSQIALKQCPFGIGRLARRKRVSVANSVSFKRRELAPQTLFLGVVVGEVDGSLEAPHCLQVLDIDGDGDVDAATCARLSKLAVWYENNGRGEFTPRVVGKDQAAYDIRVLDMDGDQDLDFLIAGEANKNIVWYENPSKRR